MDSTFWYINGHLGFFPFHTPVTFLLRETIHSKHKRCFAFRGCLLDKASKSLYYNHFKLWELTHMPWKWYHIMHERSLSRQFYTWQLEGQLSRMYSFNAHPFMRPLTRYHLQSSAIQHDHISAFINRLLMHGYSVPVNVSLCSTI